MVLSTLACLFFGGDFLQPPGVSLRSVEGLLSRLSGPFLCLYRDITEHFGACMQPLNLQPQTAHGKRMKKDMRSSMPLFLSIYA